MVKSLELSSQKGGRPPDMNDTDFTRALPKKGVVKTLVKIGRTTHKIQNLTKK
jgi:hypothetical protein